MGIDELRFAGQIIIHQTQIIPCLGASHRLSEMQGMIFGSVPAFQDIISALTGLEAEINRVR